MTVKCDTWKCASPATTSLPLRLMPFAGTWFVQFMHDGSASYMRLTSRAAYASRAPRFCPEHARELGCVQLGLDYDNLLAGRTVQ